MEDYLHDCLADTKVAASAEQFMEAFCARCMNAQCKRSRASDLRWYGRMARQEDALWRPQFADPQDPLVRHLAEQAFESFAQSHMVLGAWESFGGEAATRPPQGILHQGDTPTTHKGVAKVLESVQHLTGALPSAPQGSSDDDLALGHSGGSAERGDASGDARPSPDPRPVVAAPVPVAEAPASPAPHAPIAAPSPPSPGGYNTAAPPDGLCLKPVEDALRAAHPPQVAPLAQDPWAVPAPKKTLVVRAADGAPVDPKKGKP